MSTYEPLKQNNGLAHTASLGKSIRMKRVKQRGGCDDDVVLSLLPEQLQEYRTL